MKHVEIGCCARCSCGEGNAVGLAHCQGCVLHENPSVG